LSENCYHSRKSKITFNVDIWHLEITIHCYKYNNIILSTYYLRTDCAEDDDTADKSGQTLMEESDNYRNQTVNVYDQEVTQVGRECENTTEKLHSGMHDIVHEELDLTTDVCFSHSVHHDWYSSSYWKHCLCISSFKLCTAYTFDEE
jgi:hypothetical protein